MATLYHNGQATITDGGKEKKITLPDGATFGGRPVRTVLEITDADEAKALRAKGFSAPPKSKAPEAVKAKKKSKPAKITAETTAKAETTAEAGEKE